MEVDQGASPRAMSKEGSEADLSDMAFIDVGGVPTMASAAGIRQFQGQMLSMIQQKEFMLSQWKLQRDHVEADSARQALAQIHQYVPASSSTTEAEPPSRSRFQVVGNFKATAVTLQS
eukprot:6486718-Amphidinium_carterae.1